MFNESSNFPDGMVHDRYLGFKCRLEENLGVQGIGSKKALDLFRLVKREITSVDQIPGWIPAIISAIERLPSEASSVLRKTDVSDESVLDF